MVIEKETANHYKISKENAHNIIAARILTEHGDTVEITAIIDDPDDSTFYQLVTH